MRHNGLLFAFLLIASFSLASDTPQPLRNRRIVLDAGHGVINFQNDIINPGQSGFFGQIEHKVNFDIVQKLADILQKEGAKIIFTRDRTDYWRQSTSAAEDNKNRAYLANELKADALLSIHCDWHPRSKINGITTLYAKRNSQSLGSYIHKNLIRDLKAKDRMVVKDTFTILDHAEMPALIIETGFLSNWNEAKKLYSTEYRIKIANAIAKGVKAYFISKLTP